MPRDTETKRKPIAYSCFYDRGVYEVYVDNVFVSSHGTKTEALGEARRLRIPRPRYLHLDIRYKSICTWGSGSDVCKYWKNCVKAKGTTFTQPWGKKMLMLLEMKRQAKQPFNEPKKDKDLDRFFD